MTLFFMLNPKQFLHRGPKFVRRNFGTKKTAKKKLARLSPEIARKVEVFHDEEKNLQKVRDAMSAMIGGARLAKLRQKEIDLELKTRALIIQITQMQEEEELLLAIILDET